MTLPKTFFDDVVCRAVDPADFVRLPNDVAEKIAPDRTDRLWQDEDTRLWMESIALEDMFPRIHKQLFGDIDPSEIFLVSSFDREIKKIRHKGPNEIDGVFKTPSCLEAIFYQTRVFESLDYFEVILREEYGLADYSSCLPRYQIGDELYNFSNIYDFACILNHAGFNCYFHSLTEFKEYYENKGSVKDVQG
jgi:hypothetical protein